MARQIFIPGCNAAKALPFRSIARMVTYEDVPYYWHANIRHRKRMIRANNDVSRRGRCTWSTGSRTGTRVAHDRSALARRRIRLRGDPHASWFASGRHSYRPQDDG